MTQTSHAYPTGTAATLEERYRDTRKLTEQLCQPLSPEDCVIQSMPDASPTRWHLAHTTWFFENFVLAHIPGYRMFQPEYGYLFNSYYNSVGEQFPRPRRGLLSRPGLAEILEYRRHVDEQIVECAQTGRWDDRAARVIELGLHHEQQHQELILTDLKHLFSCNPLYPSYHPAANTETAAADDHDWLEFDGDVRWIGHDGDGFGYDNEFPRHRVLLEDFQLASRPVSCGEYLRFIQDDGYRRPELWLSLGWQTVREQSWQAPQYWIPRDDQWFEFTLAGLRPLDLHAPVCHVSYFEADAFARWTGARLPTEAEWETAAATVRIAGRFADTLLAANAVLHPGGGAVTDDLPARMFGDVWEWTASPYMPYPGYIAPAGALGEYNGKFMCNQYVLRGGSCATPSNHIRRTYRNFFPPETRWQFSGFRLAR